MGYRGEPVGGHGRAVAERGLRKVYSFSYYLLRISLLISPGRKPLALSYRARDDLRVIVGYRGDWQAAMAGQ